MLLVLIPGVAAAVLVLLMVLGACRAAGEADDALQEIARQRDVLDFDWPERPR